MATHAVISTFHILGLSRERLKLTEGIIEHGAAMRMDVFILLVAAAWLFKGSVRMRWILTPMLLPITFVYLVSERRAAVIGLAAAFRCSPWCCSGSAVGCSSR